MHEARPLQRRCGYEATVIHTYFVQCGTVAGQGKNSGGAARVPAVYLVQRSTGGHHCHQSTAARLAVRRVVQVPPRVVARCVQTTQAALSDFWRVWRVGLARRVGCPARLDAAPLLAAVRCPSSPPQPPGLGVTHRTGPVRGGVPSAAARSPPMGLAATKSASRPPHSTQGRPAVQEGLGSSSVGDGPGAGVHGGLHDGCAPSSPRYPACSVR